MDITKFHKETRYLRRVKGVKEHIERCSCCSKPCTFGGKYYYERDRFKIEFYTDGTSNICLWCWDKLDIDDD